MKKNKLIFWAFVGPSLLAFTLVVLAPLLMGIYYSFTNWNGIAANVSFVGLDNYIEMFNDSSFLDSFIFTTKFTIVSVIAVNAIGFALALLVTRGLKISNFLRTIFFMPNLIGGLILGFIWQFIFTKGFAALGELTGQGWLLGWLSNQETGFWGLAILLAWKMSGYVMVIYVAGIQGIPEELVEAAKIDGANAWERVKHIVFPLIRPAFTASLFLTLSNSFKLFDPNLSLTSGGPARSTEMLALNIYKTAFTFREMGVAQAKAVIFLIVVGIVTLTQVHFTKKGEVEM
ncbi:carbohydrate ABC transporter permease [Halanaerobacter jeridensis]|uniref:Raffinose/stachyose/melibiose transport system permease protein n=1 Tax=Halanaerobacter jeridensis TaxID=706427 RepID=A0A939BQZ7_9FIRM|nr:sugar ABC transporter permease [Halanaerobacter jeridensis]MBM7555456.1 raffinose/stachyose/melibiose transport system permease protein [Halanaerobacter jeridensis]